MQGRLTGTTHEFMGSNSSSNSDVLDYAREAFICRREIQYYLELEVYCISDISLEGKLPKST
jgi:hypothetical protein